MAVTPGLSDIQGYQGDAAIGAAAGGANISVVDSGASLPYLNTASKYIADATKTEAEEYRENLKNALTGVGSIKTDGIMSSDYKTITDTYASYLKDFFENPDIFRNPLKNPSLYNEFKQKEMNLRTTIEQSKQQKLLFDTSRDQLQKHPEWDNDENRAILNNFEKTPITDRKVFSLTAPFVPDIDALAKSVEASATVKSASSDLVRAGKFILTEKKEYIDLDKAQQALQSALYGNDTFNKNLRNGYQKLFNAMPVEEQAKYKDVNDFLWKNVSAKLKLPQTTESKLDENQFAVQAQSQAFQARENSLNRDVQRRGQDIQLELAGLRNQKNINPEVAGAYKVELMTNLFKTGKADLSVLQSAFGDNKEVEVTSKKMAPADPSKPYNALTNPNIEQGESIKEKKPRHEVIASNLDAQGNLIIDIRDNVTGKLLPRKTITEQDASNAFNNILGKDKAGIVADGTRKYLKNKTGSEIFDINKTAPLFGFNDKSQTPSTGSYSNQRQIKDRSGNLIQAGVKDGKWYNTVTGKEIK